MSIENLKNTIDSSYEKGWMAGYESGRNVGFQEAIGILEGVYEDRAIRAIEKLQKEEKECPNSDADRFYPD